MRELEFLPEDYIRARFQRRIGFLRTWLLLALGLVMVLWSFQMGAWVRDARAELQALQGTGTAVDPDVAKVKMLRAEAQSYSRRLELMRTLRPRRTATEVVAAVADLVPEGIVLDEVGLDHADGAGRDRAKLRLAGLAPSEAVVTRALGALEGTATFERAVLVESKPIGTDGRRSFIIETDVAPTAKE